MIWKVKYLKEAVKDLSGLDQSQRIQVLKAIQKVSKNPLSTNKGGYGKPLGNHAAAKLAGYYKIKLRKLGVLVVYGLVKDYGIMRIIIISVRTDDEVYRLAEKRLKG